MFKKDIKVFSEKFGIGTIVKDDYQRFFPILVLFNKDKFYQRYTTDGFRFLPDDEINLKAQDKIKAITDEEAEYYSVDSILKHIEAIFSSLNDKEMQILRVNINSLIELRLIDRNISNETILKQLKKVIEQTKKPVVHSTGNCRII